MTKSSDETFPSSTGVTKGTGVTTGFLVLSGCYHEVELGWCSRPDPFDALSHRLTPTNTTILGDGRTSPLL